MSRQRTSKPKGKKKAKRKPAISIEFDKGEYKVSDSKHAMNDEFVSKLLLTKQKLKRWSTLQKQRSGIYHVDTDGKERENVIWKLITDEEYVKLYGPESLENHLEID